MDTTLLRFLSKVIAVVALVGVAACSTPGPGQAPDGIWDPNETANRKVHAFNKKLDQGLVRPVARSYDAVVPDSMQYSVTNVADALGTPKAVVNQILQGDLPGATENTVRFVVNGVLGFLWLADPATEIGLLRNDTDFGETLYVWGVPEGAYVESPFTGPSTQRDRAGRIVDLFLNPLDRVIPTPERYYGTGVRVANGLGKRAQFGDTVDSILYESADSYAQSRMIYLQNRRFELGQTVEDIYIDPDAIDTTGF